MENPSYLNSDDLASSGMLIDVHVVRIPYFSRLFSLFFSSVFLWVYWELLCFVWGNIGSWISYGIEPIFIVCFLWVYWELLCFVWLGNIGSWISYGIERLKGHKHGGILGAGLVMELSG
jgi:hypothetical protein